jgi:hypothetical protein
MRALAEALLICPESRTTFIENWTAAGANCSVRFWGILNSMWEWDCWHETVKEVLDTVKKEYPGVSLLALGQTVFWDEPTKAMLLPAIRDQDLQREFIFAVHDTDYFGKLPAGTHVPEHADFSGFAILPHNDGSTKGLWSAAGEISQLFGSETIPTRTRYIEAGVPFEKIARYYPGGRETLIETMTEAWGWRGLVHLQDDSITVRDLPLSRVQPALEALLKWGLQNSIDSFVEPDRRAKANEHVQQILESLHQHARSHPDWSLSDFYSHVVSHILEWLIGKCPPYVKFSASSRLLQFNTQTATLPRFQLLNLFLNPETRPAMEEAYNQAVRGSEIYTLDRFGEGGLPFDLLIPGRGRGTLLLTERYLTIQTPEPVIIRLTEPVQSVEQLAQMIERHLGQNCVLTGKAITLISMVAHEFMFVMNESSSPYISRTKQLHAFMQEHHIDWAVYPILRLRYAVWDSIGADCIWLRLPEHLAGTFGQQEVCTPSFARRWRAVVMEQQTLLSELSHTTRPRDLLCLLEERVGGSWAIQRKEYDQLQTYLQDIHGQVARIQEEMSWLYQQIKSLKAERAQTERMKGEHFRQYLMPLREQMWNLHARSVRTGAPVQELEMLMSQHDPQRAEFDKRLRTIRDKIHSTWEHLRTLNEQRLSLERDSQTQQVRQRVRQIEREAELARMGLVRNAILTAGGLNLTNARPAWWWFYLLSPGGEWFRANAGKTEAYLDKLT